MFAWSRYLELAKELALRTDEASLRSAISRAYYAAYCTARNALRSRRELGVDVRESHAVVWNAFLSRPDPNQRKIGMEGKRLHMARRRADYEDVIPNLAHLVQGTLLQADALLGEISAFDSPSSGSAS